MKLLTTDLDDPDFVEIIESVKEQVLKQYKPQMVTIVQIDGWFSHKWLHFSGVIHLQLGVWRRETTIPPFIPDRVMSQIVFQKNDAGYEKIDAPPIHQYKYSGSNLKNTIKNHTESGAFIWWSGDTLYEDNGCIMVYTQEENLSSTWYASFVKKEAWKVNKVKNISMPVFKRFLPNTQQAYTPDLNQ